MLGEASRGGSALDCTIYPYTALLNNENEWEFFGFAHEHTTTEVSKGYHRKFHEPVPFRLLARGPAINKDFCMCCGNHNEGNITIEDGPDAEFFEQQPPCCHRQTHLRFPEAARIRREQKERSERSTRNHPPPLPISQPHQHGIDLDRTTSTLLRRAELSRSELETKPFRAPDHLPPRTQHFNTRDSASSTSTQDFTTPGSSQSSHSSYKGKSPARQKHSGSTSGHSAGSSSSSGHSYAQAARPQPNVGPIAGMFPGIHAKPKSRSVNTPIVSYHLVRPSSDQNLAREPAKSRKFSN